MYGSRRAVTKLETFHVASRDDRYWNDEGAKHIGTVPPQCVRLRHRDHEVGLSERPFAMPLRHRGQIAAIALLYALFDPSVDERHLRVGETPFAGELAEARLRLPRRH